MNQSSEKLINKLVVTAVTIFVLVLLLVGALVGRHFWLQQRIVDLSQNVEIRLEGLDEITIEIEEELDDLQAPGGGTSDNLETLSDALVDVDDQLEDLGADLGEVIDAMESDLEPAAPADDAAAPADQLFTIFAVLVGLAAIVVAILWGVILWMQFPLAVDF